MFKRQLDKITLLLKSPKAYGVARKVYFGLGFVVLFFTLYHIGYSKRIIPGVKIGDVFVGGMTYDEAYDAFSETVEALEPKLVLTHENIKHELTAGEISLQYDIANSVSRAFEVGRSGSIFRDTKDKLASLVKNIRVKAYYNWDDDLLSGEFSKLRGEINHAAVEPSFVIADDGSLSVTPPVTGEKVSDQGVYDVVISSFDYLEFSEKEIPVSKLEPSLKAEDLEEARGEVERIISKPLTVKAGENSWELSPKQKFDFIKIEPRLIGSKLSLNRANFEAYVDGIALEINKQPRGKVTRIENNVVLGFELTGPGEELDEKKFTEDFERALLGEETEAVIVMNVINNLSDPSKYGIYALLGEGSSKFAGSAAARIHNLTLAAERTDGVLVPPGGTYSFNNSVGAINGATGYDTAYIISNGRTVLGEGGGVCQTSTTMFRAVLDAGLPIVTRHPHAYRVYYYEQDRPVGFDASVFQPSLDFQFKNDTPNHVLVATSWNLDEQTLTFKLYGTPDGREVEITEPVVTNEIAPPEALYQDDPTLDKGVVRQVDFSAWGATAQFSRTVTRGGEILSQDTFKSTYQPWRAIFMVGTKET